MADRLTAISSAATSPRRPDCACVSETSSLVAQSRNALVRARQVSLEANSGRMKCGYNGLLEQGRRRNGFLTERGAAADPGVDPQAVRGVRRRLLAGEGSRRRFPA